VLFRFILRVFFGSMQSGIADHACNLDGMADMLTEFYCVAFDFPCTAILCGQFVFVGVVTFLKAARERARFLMRGFLSLLGAGDSTAIENNSKGRRAAIFLNLILPSLKP
jgi:hypothetical protein